MRTLSILATSITALVLSSIYARAEALGEETSPEILQDSDETEAPRQAKANADLERSDQEYARRWRTSRREVSEKHPQTLDLLCDIWAN